MIRILRIKSVFASKTVWMRGMRTVAHTERVSSAVGEGSLADRKLMLKVMLETQAYSMTFVWIKMPQDREN